MPVAEVRRWISVLFVGCVGNVINEIKPLVENEFIDPPKMLRIVSDLY